MITGVREVTRTPDLPLRRRSLYPTELRRHDASNSHADSISQHWWKIKSFAEIHMGAAALTEHIRNAIIKQIGGGTNTAQVFRIKEGKCIHEKRCCSSVRWVLLI